MPIIKNFLHAYIFCKSKNCLKVSIWAFRIWKRGFSNFQGWKWGIFWFLGGCYYINCYIYTISKSQNAGRTSADRRTRPTLMLTVPGFRNKVVYRGFTKSNGINCYDERCWRNLSLHAYIRQNIIAFSKDSDLEAFSHNPTDGSFTALAVQLTVLTNYLNQRFLSY